MLTGKPIYTVSLLAREVKKLLETSYANIQVEGEISGLSCPISGHQYFNIKDEKAQLRCAFFKNSARLSNIQLADGMQVILSARVSLYEQRGDFQLIVQSVVDAGEGRLRREFERLKVRLGAEGLFDLSRKSVLPSLPRRVGIITSPSGAAIHDMISVFKRRYPSIQILIYPAIVQGEKAIESLVSAIRTADERKECDVLIVARGGGSLEDLWAFNEEAVARAIYQCTIPIVSAVGHETDFSISDLVADARAATPTAAAELLSPDREHLLKVLKGQQLRLFNAMSRQIEALGQQNDMLLSRLGSFKHKSEQDKFRYSILAERFYRLSINLIKDRKLRLSGLISRIYSPKKTLEQRALHYRNLEYALLRAVKSNYSSANSAYSSQHKHLSSVLARNQLQAKTIYLSATIKRLWHNTPQILNDKRNQLEKQVIALQSLSPLQTLARGFATLQVPGQNKIISSVEQVDVGDEIQANLRDGYLHCNIVRKFRNNHD